jgi:hypothetical protein
MSKNAQRHTRATFTKQSNQACMLLDHAPKPPRLQCVAYITGFGFVRPGLPRFVPVLRKADALPAWKSPTLLRCQQTR